MKPKILLITAVLLGVLFTLTASAAIYIPDPPCGVVPIQQLSYTTTTQIEKFDKELGCLKSVKLSVETCGNITREISSEDPSVDGVDYEATVIGQIIPNIPSIGEDIFQIIGYKEFHAAPDDDDAPDWKGPDYFKVEEGIPDYNCTSKEYIITDATGMAPYIGNKGDKVQIPVRTRSSNTVIGSNEYQSRGQTFMGVTVCVEYVYEPLCINGTKIDDSTGNGLEGWTISLSKGGAVINTTVTDIDGKYSFCNLAPGTYEVCEELKDGWYATTPMCVPVTLSCDTGSVNNVNFHNKELATLGDYVWNDLDMDGIQDADEPGVSGVTVNLYDCNGLVATTITDADGYYLFEDLQPNDDSCCYYVEFELPDGFVFTMKDAGADDSKDSDADQTTGRTDCITLDPGETDLTWDAGIFLERATLGDYVWNDLDMDGIQDADEPGVSGVTVNLYDCNDLVATTITDADGYYLFEDLQPNDDSCCYYVEFELPDGFVFTMKDAGADDSKDSDADQTTGRTDCITLDPGETDLTWDAGIYILKFCIDGTKIDACTGPLGGWTINLYKGEDLIKTTTTDATDGSYKFCDLYAGDYKVCEIVKDGWINITPTCYDVELIDKDETVEPFENMELLCISGSKLDACTGLGLDGWEIILYDSVNKEVGRMTTTNGGEYSFCDLEPGSYTVCETTQAGWKPVGDTCKPVTLVCDNVTDVNFVNTPLLCISGTKIDDCTEEGLDGWTISLKDAAGQVIKTATTSDGGKYRFCDLEPGSYTVCETTQAGWMPVGDTCIPVDLVCDNVTDVNFENTPLLCISGYKFNYEDNSPLEGWEICLTKPDGTEVCTTTDATGKYQFCDLVSGTYTVCETLMDGWTNVTPLCITVDLDCEDSTDNDFYNAPEKECETAWAKIEPSTCFPGTGNWGWYTKIPKSSIKPGEPYEESGDIWAGAAKCDTSKGTLVGTAYVTLTANEFHVTTDLLDSCTAEDLHVWVGYEPPSGPVGRYPYKTADVKFKTPLDTSKDIYIAIHWGDMCCAKCFYKGTC